MSKRIKVKPGKTQSLMGFFVGIVFCLIGFLIAIPAAGLFGVFWTLMAVIITVTNGISAFSDKGISTHEIVIDDGEENRESSTGLPKTDAEREMDDLTDDIEIRLKAAEELYQNGTITREEYESKRKEILERL